MSVISAGCSAGSVLFRDYYRIPIRQENHEWNYVVTNACDDGVGECMTAIKGRKSRFARLYCRQVWLRTECLIKYV